LRKKSGASLRRHCHRRGGRYEEKPSFP